ncbi:DUF4183 domain-containing protein [Sporosarcina psychrophila]|uniref:DUF4183 domain-containing protein n=1 Tax=Sporosarcina psychrophila TaxID=1476 RepID=UPI00078D85A8|nr:DUF4183 domain-containing protein [Sporosarcina psychrophila]AMQ04608.1 hypothetical protein AZE41_00745 [Sporosarcina psychrophila]
MERHKKCKKVVRMIDYKNYSKKIVCQTPIEVIPTNNSEFSIIPNVKRYFYIPVANINVTNGVTIPANLFYNDDGSSTIEFMNFIPNGYANLYINALMQEGGMYEVSTNSLTISPANAIIYARTPIIVELLSFSTKLI